MKRNQLTEVMETKQGYLVLQVLEHYDEGEQSLAKVKNEIMDKLYSARMEPAMREYLKTLREQSYVVIKPGYQDITLLAQGDRKSTRLNSSHVEISYAVFCLKKKKHNSIKSES